MPRNLVVCCDGTNNQFGSQNTNVVRLVQALTRDPQAQLVYYDPGIGTMPEPGFLERIGTRVYDALDSAFATGLTAKVEAAYTHLVDAWEPGDAIYLFGFSRGAYTVRVLAGMLHELGLLPRGNQNLVPYAMRYFGAMRGSGGDQPSASAKAYWDLCDTFRQTFAREVPGVTDRRMPVHFVGVWDTVSSVGWAWEPARYPFSAHNPTVQILRHAVSVDERRWFFRQNLFQGAPGQDVRELWFPGVHSDIGGGYPETEGGLWRVAFEWMIAEAQQTGLRVDPARLAAVLTRPPVPARPWAEPAHESLHGAWWLAEFFPKRVYDWVTKRRHLSIGRGRHRFVHNGATMHRSVLERLRAGTYAPPNLSSSFVATVRALAEVPDELPYVSGDVNQSA